MAVKPMINKKITKVNFTDSNRDKSEIKYLVKHYVGASGGAEANVKFFYNTYRGASAHYFIGHDGEIWQCVNENDIAWHCGASSYKHEECRNSNSIGVELCVKKDKNGNWYYTEKTKEAAVKLFTYLMDKYEIDYKHVLRHYDVTGKACGEPDMRTGSRIWNEFKKSIKQYGKNNTEKKLYVKVICPVLNIRNKASFSDSAVCGTVKKGRKFEVEKKVSVGKSHMYKLTDGKYVTASEKYVRAFEK